MADTAQMTTDELSRSMATQLRQNILLKDIRQDAAAKGFTPVQITAALDQAHTLVQQQADRDPWIRLLLGPVLLGAAYIGFYADWAGRSVGFGTIIGLVLLLIGGRLIFSLLKQWLMKSK